MHYTTHPLFPSEPELINADELSTWILVDDDDLLVIDKPGWVVCHPSKAGPWSSLVGACREWTGLETLHLVARLDRETSGLILLAKHRAAAKRYQGAIEKREVTKTYLALLHGELKEETRVQQRLAKDLESAIASKIAVRRSNSSKSAETIFKPLAEAHGFTLCEINPVTGRKHQIRAHAQWLGHPVVGDKLYGQPDGIFLEFIEHGWTDLHSQTLPMRRHALHCARLAFQDGPTFNAAVPWDIQQFCLEKTHLDAIQTWADHTAAENR